MKRLKNILITVLTLLLVMSFTGCAEGNYSGKGGWDSGYAPDAPGSWAGGEDFSASDDVTDKDDTADKDDDTADKPGDEWFQQSVKKQLTAAEWNDLNHYEFWNSLFLSKDGQTEGGIFGTYAKNRRGLDTAGMREVKVVSGSTPVAGATVKLYRGENVIYTAVTDGSGKAYVFGGDATGVEAKSGEFATRAPLTDDSTTEISLYGYVPKSEVIDVAVVIDTTGSMGDELSFIKKEISGVVRRVSESAPDCVIRLGLVCYRDYNVRQEELYLTREFDFENVSVKSGMSNALNFINAQSAGGGGDTPEAVEAGLETAVNLQWSDSSTKILFHVLDAPYHDEEQYASKFAETVYKAAAKGIRIVPVAASGLDTLGQYIMRSAAMLTGGTYAFLTDDSGIGDSHTEPATGGYTVEYLSDLMVRLVVGYHTGDMGEAVYWKDSPSVA